MGKYLSVFKISFAQEFAYKVNFILWRVRNVLQIFLVFFLWDTVFQDPGRVVFGYDRAKILTYVFAILVVKALVLSARAVDVPGEISRGELSNYLLKPIGYFKYWLTRDLSSKALNLSFAVFEFLFLYILIKPPLFVQTNPVLLFGFLVSITLALMIFFTLLFTTGLVPFWRPEWAGGLQFMIIFVATEFLAGGLFPLDILPANIQKVLFLTPFPYLIFFPIQVYLGKLSSPEMIKGIMAAFIWAVALYLFMRNIWQKGLKVYQSHGR
jgi:ABC-2 type transport system permease protein